MSLCLILLMATSTCLGSIIVAAIVLREPVRQSNEPTKGSAASERHEPEADQKSSLVIRPPPSATPQLMPPNNERDEPINLRWTNDPGIFWATVAGVVAVIAYTSVSAWQASLMRKQLDEMQAERRPWLREKITRVGDFNISDQRVSFDVSAEVVNIGKSPAYSIGIAIDILPMDNFSPEKSELLKGQLFQCSVAEAWSRGDTHASMTIFPDDFSPLIYDMPINKVMPTEKFVIKTRPDNGIVVMPVVVGCISYKVQADGPYHHTMFAYDIRKALPNNQFGFIETFPLHLDGAGVRIKRSTLAKNTAT